MKLVFVCFDYKSSNLRKQPWRYVDELTRKLDGDIQPVIVTDCESNVEGIRVQSVSTLTSLTGPSDELISTVQDENPDVVATVLGPSSFVRLRTLAGIVDAPTIGIMTSPLYDLLELSQVGIREFYRHWSYLSAHLLGAISPTLLIKRHLEQFDRIITMTRDTENTLGSIAGNTHIETVPPGIDPFDVELPPASAVEKVRTELSPDEDLVVLYFTSPLTLRGTDTLVRAFTEVQEMIDAKLIILSRQDGGGLNAEEDLLLDLASELGIADNISIIPRNLSPVGVKTYLRASDVVALPYKIVISGVPISILEAMAMGRPVVTTSTDGLPELVSDRDQLAPPNQVRELAATIQSNMENRKKVGERNRQYMTEYHSWQDTRELFKSIINTTYE